MTRNSTWATWLVATIDQPAWAGGKYTVTINRAGGSGAIFREERMLMEPDSNYVNTFNTPEAAEAAARKDPRVMTVEHLYKIKWSSNE